MSRARISTSLRLRTCSAIAGRCWGGAFLTAGTAFISRMLRPLASTGGRKNRVVTLRAADPAAKTLRFHCDKRNLKVAELAANPAIALSFYDVSDRTQIRAEGRAVLHSGDAFARAAWDGSRPMSRVCYGTAPAPGSVIAARDAFALPDADDAIAAGFENFVAVVIMVETMDWLYLRHGGHRRAAFDLRDGSARWLAP